MKKILCVFGTRPEAIKMAPVVRKLKAENKIFETRVCVSAQHRELLDQALSIFDIPVKYDLNIMTTNQTLQSTTTKTIEGVTRVFHSYLPDMVLVHGDTTTAFATSIAAFYEGIPIGHIEAGLRTNDINAPFPEEFNRQVISKVAALHFAPSQTSMNNLVNEGIPKNRIFVTGNTVIDALKITLDKINTNNKLISKIDRYLTNELFERWDEKPSVVVTIHRRENNGDAMQNIAKAIGELAKQEKEINFFITCHPNNQFKKISESILGNLDNVVITKALDYDHFAYLMSKCMLVLTDSGGIQEEAPAINKPVVVLREKTERQEAVLAGTVKVVSPAIEQIIASVKPLLNYSSEYYAMAQALNPYGDGTASDCIISALKRYYYER